MWETSCFTDFLCDMDTCFQHTFHEVFYNCFRLFPFYYCIFCLYVFYIGPDLCLTVLPMRSQSPPMTILMFSYRGWLSSPPFSGQLYIYIYMLYNYVIFIICLSSCIQRVCLDWYFGLGGYRGKEVCQDVPVYRSSGCFLRACQLGSRSGELLSTWQHLLHFWLRAATGTGHLWAVWGAPSLACNGVCCCIALYAGEWPKHQPPGRLWTQRPLLVTQSCSHRCGYNHPSRDRP